MRDLAGDRGIFIRSMASRGNLGGLAWATADGPDYYRVRNVEYWDILYIRSGPGVKYEVEGAIPCKHLIPLMEIIAEALGQGAETKGVEKEYLRLVSYFGSEFRIVLDVTLEELEKMTEPRIVEGMCRV